MGGVEGGLVAVVVVGFSVFPHLEEDADPFEGEGADGGVVFHAGGFFALVKGFGPGAPASGVVGEFVEGLLEELGAGAARLDRLGLAAVLGDGNSLAGKVANRAKNLFVPEGTDR